MLILGPIQLNQRATRYNYSSQQSFFMNNFTFQFDAPRYRNFFRIEKEKRCSQNVQINRQDPDDLWFLQEHVQLTPVKQSLQIQKIDHKKQKQSIDKPFANFQDFKQQIRDEPHDRSKKIKNYYNFRVKKNLKEEQQVNSTNNSKKSDRNTFLNNQPKRKIIPKLKRNNINEKYSRSSKSDNSFDLRENIAEKEQDTVQNLVKNKLKTSRIPNRNSLLISNTHFQEKNLHKQHKNKNFKSQIQQIGTKITKVRSEPQILINTNLQKNKCIPQQQKIEENQLLKQLQEQQHIKTQHQPSEKLKNRMPCPYPLRTQRHWQTKSHKSWYKLSQQSAKKAMESMKKLCQKNKRSPKKQKPRFKF